MNWSTRKTDNGKIRVIWKRFLLALIFIGTTALICKCAYIGPDLSKADLSFADFSHTNLNGTKLAGADLSYADFSQANLSDADLTGADLSNALFSQANLTGANLRETNISGADFASAIGLSQGMLNLACLFKGGQPDELPKGLISPKRPCQRTWRY